MSQKTISSFFVSRKRRHHDDIGAAKKRVCLQQQSGSDVVKSQLSGPSVCVAKSEQLPTGAVEKTGRPDRRGRAAAVSQQKSTSAEASLAPTLMSSTMAEASLAPTLMSSTSAGVRSALLRRSVVGVQRRLFDDEEPLSSASAVSESKKTSVAAPPAELSLASASASKMSPLKMKVSLQGCNKIQQLREKLALFNRATDKLKKFQLQQPSKSSVMPTRGERSLEFEISSPQKTPRKLLLSPSPAKSPSVKQCLKLMGATPSSLTLPFKYRQLKETFHSVDTCASFLHNRKEVITLGKLRASVQQMLGRPFRERHLAQICAVFPDAYVVRRERHLPTHCSTPNSKHKWQLTVTINMDYANVNASCEKHRKLTPQRLLERSRIFSVALLDLVRQQHADFLRALEPPLPVPSVEQLRHWHAEFPLEEVPDVEPAPLPGIPVDQTPATAADLLQRASSVLQQYPALQQSLQQVAASSADRDSGASSCSTAAPEAAPAATAATTSAPGLPVGLLARIRAREAARASREMTRSPADQRRRDQLARLPDLVRPLRAIFVTERRSALPAELVVARLTASVREQLSGEQLQQLLQLLADVQPRFLEMLSLKAGAFVKLDRDRDLNGVVKSLQEQVQQA